MQMVVEGNERGEEETLLMEEEKVNVLLDLNKDLK